MPELPEVETVKRAISQSLRGQTIANVIVRNPNLRLPIEKNFAKKLTQQTIHDITRRSKYLVLHLSDSCLVIHLGMSGRILLLPNNTQPEKHDHIDLNFQNICLRYRDPRRFGLMAITPKEFEQHALFSHLGVEPLSELFDGHYLHQALASRRTPIKQAIMDAQIVVGVGNIYANEALFESNIHPLRPANSLTQKECKKLIVAIKHVLRVAIESGGTTLRDFYSADGSLGYFQQKLKVYQRHQQDCLNCSQLIEKIIIGNRSSFYCQNCQI